MNIPFLPRFLPRDPASRRAEFERSLIRTEAEIGGRLFGPVRPGAFERQDVGEPGMMRPGRVDRRAAATGDAPPPGELGRAAG